MARFIEITAVLLRRTNDDLPLQFHDVEEDMVINTDLIVSVSRRTDRGCNISMRQLGQVHVTQTYEYIHQFLIPACHLGNPRG
jgi:hypothetical protein